MKEFLPIYMQMGFGAFRPFEIAANNELVAIGKQYPTIVLCGGIDKRILGESPVAIKNYLTSIMPFFTKRGGYIPTCDHAIPSTVSFTNYVYYRQLKPKWGLWPVCAFDGTRTTTLTVSSEQLRDG